jgi:hypothetical protein
MNAGALEKTHYLEEGGFGPGLSRSTSLCPDRDQVPVWLSFKVFFQKTKLF